MSDRPDLVIRGATIVDGKGGLPYVGDLAVADGRIASIGRIEDRGRQEIDARDRIVTPGFIDIHTHYDGHATWTNRLDPSSHHGVTTVVTGNCGVGFAPCKPEDRERLIHLMEGVEDIPEIVMTAGLPWNWTSFPEYLDSLSTRRFDMDVAVQLPHAPLRVFVMGDRAADKEPATSDDIAAMRRLTREAIEAGALGFSTSRSLNHKAKDGSLTPSYLAAAEELVGIAMGLRDAGMGVLQFVSDFDDVDAEFDIVRRMVKESGRPLSMSLIQYSHVPDRWRAVLNGIEQARDDGLPIKGQISGRPIGMMLGFGLGRNPFMYTEGFQDIAALSDADRLAELRTPDRRARILAEFPGQAGPQQIAMTCNFSGMYEFNSSADYVPGQDQSVGAQADRQGTPAPAFAYDLLVDGRTVFYVPSANYAGNSTEAIERMLRSDDTLFGLGDGGAHCGLICDASLPTYMLERWSDAKHGDVPIGRIVRRLTSDNAEAVGLADRGRIEVGLRADLNIIDMERLGLKRPTMVRDLPEGGGRLEQEANGYDVTIVAGEVTYRLGAPTGSLPGRLVRGTRLGTSLNRGHAAI